MNSRSTDLLNLWAATLTVMGAVAWGVIGLFRFNLFKRRLGAPSGAERLLYVAIGLAGAWMAGAAIVPRLMIALGRRGEVRTSSWRGMSIVGKLFPRVSGTTLDGTRVTVPTDTRGKVTLLVTGYDYDSRFEVEDWVEAFQSRFGENPEVAYFVMPMIGGFYRLLAPMIDEGMRRGSPPESHKHTLTIYGDIDPLRKALAASPSSSVWLYLLDREGKVLYQHSGAFDERDFQELASLVESTLGRPVTRGRKVA